MAAPAVTRSEAELLLEEWGHWVRSGSGIPRYQSPAWVLLRENVGSTVRAAMITDDMATLIDGLVARLGQTNAEAADLLVMYYVAGFSYPQIARRRGVTRQTVSDIVRHAVAWIDGAMAAIC